MSLPEGVSTCNVTFGKALSQFGTVARLTGKVTMDRRVIHAATGYSINPADEDAPRSDDDDLLSFAVPHVDQEGFLDPATQLATTHWYYTLSGKIIFAGGGKTLSFTKTFQPLVGQTDIDLDFLPDGTPTPGVTAPTAEVSSVAGQTGHVSTSALRTALGVDTLEEDLDGKADLDETGRVGYPQLPEALSPSGLTASKAYIVPDVEPDTGADLTAALHAEYAAADGKPVRLVKPGVYLVDGLVLDQPGRLEIGQGATLKNKNNTTTLGAPVIKITSSDVSVDVQGTVDANRAGQSISTWNSTGGSNGNRGAGIQAIGSAGSPLENVSVVARRITGAIDFAGRFSYVNGGYFHLVGDTCGAGFAFDNCDDLTVPVAFARDIDNAGASNFPHVFDLFGVTDSHFGIITGLRHFGNGSVSGGTAKSDWISGSTLIGVRGCTFGQLSMSTSTDAGQNKGVGISLLDVTDCTFGTCQSSGYTDVQFEWGGLVDCQFGTVDLDGRYQAATGSPGGAGWNIYNNGYYHPGARSRSVRHCTGNTVASFIIRRHVGDGIGFSGGFDNTFMSGKVYGNRRGARFRYNPTTYSDNFANQTPREPKRNRFIGCDFHHNERSGYEMNDGAHTDLIDCRAWNNGQAHNAPGNETRLGVAVGASVFGGLYVDTSTNPTLTPSKTFLRIDEPHCFDDQSGMSVVLSGTAATGATLSTENPGRFIPGQSVTLVGAGVAGADLITRVNAVVRDEVTFQHSPSTFPTVAGTGTISTNGTTVTGSGTAFNTETNGRFWIESGGVARQIIKVASNTAATLDEAFPSDLSGASFVIYQTTATGAASQDYGIRFSSDTVRPRVIGGEFSGNLVADIQDQSGSMIREGAGVYAVREAIWALPTGEKRASVPRTAPMVGSLAALASGRLQLVAVWYNAGDVVNGITFTAGTTAAVSPTNQWFSLYKGTDRQLLAVTTDDTTTAWAGSASKRLALTTPYTIPAAGWYYHGIVVVASTVPTLMGVTTVGSVLQVEPRLAGPANSGLTDPASAPANAGAPGTSSALPWTTSD